MAVVQGTVESGYEAVRDLLEQQFAEDMHIGAGVSVYHHGRKVVDIWGGIANEETNAPWLTDTMAISWSTTKGLTATCLHVLADRGLVDYQAPVAKYWPEFAQNGKADITVYHILTHQSGMSQIPEGISDVIVGRGSTSGTTNSSNQSPRPNTAFHGWCPREERSLIVVWGVVRRWWWLVA